jgi:hypothetical protein
MAIDPQTLDTLLQTGLQATATIAGQRAASGKKAARQERIAACGRRPVFNRKAKEEYRKCIAEASLGGTKSMPSDDTYSPPPPPPQGGNMRFVYIGLGVLLLAGVGFFVIKKMGK